MDYNSQLRINNNFLEVYKKTLADNKIETAFFLSKLKEFEYKNINDNLSKKIISSMLTVPYYENLKPVTDIRKFKLLIEKLEVMQSELFEQNILKRLEALRNDEIEIPKINNKLLIND